MCLKMCRIKTYRNIFAGHSLRYNPKMENTVTVLVTVSLDVKLFAYTIFTKNIYSRESRYFSPVRVITLVCTRRYPYFSLITGTFLKLYV